MDLTDVRVMVTGGGGFLGSTISSKLEQRGAKPIVIRSSDFDLTRPERVRAALQETEAEVVVHAAAVVGGIGANRRHPARFFYDNAVMGIHLIHEAHLAEIRKLVIVGTVCSYPKYTPVPFHEEQLWDGYPEETNAPYGLAKKMLLVQAQAYRAEYGLRSAFVIPTNLYGPGDNFDDQTSHVIPAIIKKCITAQEEGADEVDPLGFGGPYSGVPLRRRCRRGRRLSPSAPRGPGSRQPRFGDRDLDPRSRRIRSLASRDSMDGSRGTDRTRTDSPDGPWTGQRPPSSSVGPPAWSSMKD